MASLRRIALHTNRFVTHVSKFCDKEKMSAEVASYVDSLISITTWQLEEMGGVKAETDQDSLDLEIVKRQNSLKLKKRKLEVSAHVDENLKNFIMTTGYQINKYEVTDYIDVVSGTAVYVEKCH